MKKANNPSKKRIKLLSFFLFLFVIWAGFTVYNQRMDIKQKEDVLKELKKEEEQVINTKNGLEQKVLLLQNDDYIAELARKYYFLSKPGEYIFISPEE